MFLGKTFYSQSAPLQPGVPLGSQKFNSGGNAARETLPSTGEEEYKFFQSLSATETGICFSCKYELFGLTQNVFTIWLQAKSRIKCVEQVMAGLIP